MIGTEGTGASCGGRNPETGIFHKCRGSGLQDQTALCDYARTDE